MNVIVVFPLTTVPSGLASCASAGAAKATGSATANIRVDKRFIFSPLIGYWERAANNLF
jgi:hypothetical protein